MTSSFLSEPHTLLTKPYALYSNCKLTPLVPITQATSTATLADINARGLAKATASDASRIDKMLGRGMQAAQGAARLPKAMFVIEELILGTGVNPTKNLVLTSEAGISQHADDLLSNPTATGIAGVGIGVGVATMTAKGALVGLVIGGAAAFINKVGNNPLKVDSNSTVVLGGLFGGAAVGAAFGAIATMPGTLALNLLRLSFAVMKLLCMLPFAALGFVAGSAYGLFERSATVQPEMEQRSGMQRYAPPPFPPPSHGWSSRSSSIDSLTPLLPKTAEV